MCQNETVKKYVERKPEMFFQAADVASRRKIKSQSAKGSPRSLSELLKFQRCFKRKFSISIGLSNALVLLEHGRIFLLVISIQKKPVLDKYCCRHFRDSDPAIPCWDGFWTRYGTHHSCKMNDYT